MSSLIEIIEGEEEELKSKYPLSQYLVLMKPGETFVTYKNIEEKMAKQSHILGSHDKVLLIKQLKC